MTFTDWIMQYTTGIIVLGATINVNAWFRLLIDRLKQTGGKNWRTDPYVAVRSGMLLHGPGHGIGYAWFGVSAYLAGSLPLHPAWLFILLRFMVIYAECSFIWGAYLLRIHKPLYWMIGSTIVWTLICSYWGWYTGLTF